MRRMPTIDDSIAVIEKYQAGTGAYVASPNFNSYLYSWLRDGSFIAHAMSLYGRDGSAAAFHRWVSEVIVKFRSKVERLEESKAQGQSLEGGDFLHTRYTLDGDEGPEDSGWGNFQIDGYGTWLWALDEHVRRTQDAALLQDCAEAVRLTVRYLDLVWGLPNYDLWEEHPEYLHPYTLGAVYGGLTAADGLAKAGVSGIDLERLERTRLAVRRFVLEHGVVDGRVAKHIDPAAAGKPPVPLAKAGVDASLIGLATPYGLFAMDDPLMAHTWEEIKRTLIRPGGGVYRFRSDTYFGGGEWVLLAAWFGWSAALNGERPLAESLLAWIEAQFDEDGWLPEQVTQNLLAPEYYEVWLERWGRVAKPLLWSHAMYLILVKVLAEPTAA